LEVADRIVVFNHGTVTADVSLERASRDQLIAAMSEPAAAVVEPAQDAAMPAVEGDGDVESRMEDRA
jgi:ABC-type sugar transport system ATPase subunit